MHSKPKIPKSEEVIKSGYDESDFSEDYWLAFDVNGTRRIDRKADTLLRYFRQLLNHHLITEDPRIIDVGCGPGGIVKQFLDEGYNATGCEYSASGRRLAKKHFNIDVLECDLRFPGGIPYGDESFDYAMCVGVLTMIPRDKIHVAARELSRILRPAGILLVNLLNPKPVQNQPHITAMTPKEWRHVFVNSGLEDVTSLWPPQREGIGMRDEFCGIFRKL